MACCLECHLSAATFEWARDWREVLQERDGICDLLLQPPNDFFLGQFHFDQSWLVELQVPVTNLKIIVEYDEDKEKKCDKPLAKFAKRDAAPSIFVDLRKHLNALMRRNLYAQSGDSIAVLTMMNGNQYSVSFVKSTHGMHVITSSPG